jgi:hypothetical protein
VPLVLLALVALWFCLHAEVLLMHRLGAAFLKLNSSHSLRAVFLVQRLHAGLILMLCLRGALRARCGLHSKGRTRC